MAALRTWLLRLLLTVAVALVAVALTTRSVGPPVAVTGGPVTTIGWMTVQAQAAATDEPAAQLPAGALGGAALSGAVGGVLLVCQARSRLRRHHP